MDGERFALTLALKDGFEFAADFDQPGVANLALDEPPPLGAGHGPNAARLLGAAVGNCLAASLLLCLRKARVEVLDFRARVEGTLVRNARGRLRIGDIRVSLQPVYGGRDAGRIDRCLEIFEDFCIVTESVRRGIDVKVEVEPALTATEVAPLVHG